MSEVLALETQAQADELVQFPVEKLLDAPWGNIRTQRDPQAFAELKASVIAQKGFHTPVAIRMNEDGTAYLLAGYGRRQVARELGLKTIPALVKHGLSDTDAKILMLSENVDREALSQLDSAKGARVLIQELNGDLDAVSYAMGWSKTKLNQALQLLKCSEKVQAALGVKQESGFTLGVGHACVLSALQQETQDAILDAVIRDKMTVSILKAKVAQAIERPLSSAIFDKSACATCPHNSSQQTSLLVDFAYAEDKCMNPTCFMAKEHNYHEAKLEEAKRDYGTVIMLSQLTDQHGTVSKESVGDKYVSNCLSCSKLCAVYVDTGLNLGGIKENQCLDLTCRDDKPQTKAAPKAVAAPKQGKAVDAKPSTTQASTSKTEVNNASPKTEKKTPEPKVTRGTRAHAEDHIRSVVAPKLLAQDNFKEMLLLAGIKALSGENRFPQRELPKFFDMSKEELQSQIDKGIEQLTRFGTGEKDPIINGHNMVMELAAKLNVNDDIVKAWKPTKENLKGMVKATRIQILEQSGFAIAYQMDNDESGYKKLLNMGTDEQIEAILKYSFDWTHYAPEYLLESVGRSKLV